jgi:ribonuclease VapC
MVVDTSALAGIILGEEDAEALLSALLHTDEVVRVSAATLVEATMVVEARHGPDAAGDLDLLLAKVDAEITSVDPDQGRLAVAAWRRFGKGCHPAALNLGDCFSYALARSAGETLLFKGRDFAQTDIGSALR